MDLTSIALTDMFEPLSIRLLLPLIELLLVISTGHLSLPELHSLLLGHLLQFWLFLLLSFLFLDGRARVLDRFCDMDARSDVGLELSCHVDEDFGAQLFDVPVGLPCLDCEVIDVHGEELANRAAGVKVLVDDR